eukprot:1151767-Pelagomonas_calceolata.AAC.5
MVNMVGMVGQVGMVGMHGAHHHGEHGRHGRHACASPAADQPESRALQSHDRRGRLHQLHQRRLCHSLPHVLLAGAWAASSSVLGLFASQATRAFNKRGEPTGVAGALPPPVPSTFPGGVSDSVSDSVSGGVPHPCDAFHLSRKAKQRCSRQHFRWAPSLSLVPSTCPSGVSSFRSWCFDCVAHPHLCLPPLQVLLLVPPHPSSQVIHVHIKGT